MALIAGTVLGLSTHAALAGPKGERVVRGKAEFQRDGNVTTITTGRRAIINYQSFDIAAGETVQFIQPGRNARVLNRVNSADPTRIDGNLSANGRVYLVNRSGIVFGPGSIVNVGTLHAGAGSITDRDFMQGVDRFTNVTGDVSSLGFITAEAVHLIGRRVENHGTIVADGGVVSLLVGNDVFLGERGGQIFVRIDGETVDPAAGPHAGAGAYIPTGNETAGIENTGAISAPRGRITLGAGDTFSLAIRNTGRIESPAGNITLAAHDGAIHNEGVISASVGQGRAGRVTVQAPTVINHGEVSADADSGHAGRVELTSSRLTFLGAGSRVSAAGGDAIAHGGEILIHSYQGDTVTSTTSTIDLSGGALGGDGGFGEVSAANRLGLHGVMLGDASLDSKQASILIDPLDIIISAANFNDAELLDGIILAGDGLPADIFRISTGAIEGFVGDVRLEATRDIFIGESITKANGGLVLLAGRDILFSGEFGGVIPDLRIEAHHLDFTAGRNIVERAILGTKLVSTVGDIILEATGGDMKFALATVPDNRTLSITQARSKFVGAGPFGFVGNPETTNLIVRITDGWLIFGGDFGGVTGFQDIRSVDAHATQFLRVDDNLRIRDFADLRSNDNVEINGWIRSVNAIRMHAGQDGTGNVLFLRPGLDLHAALINLRAGNGSGLGLARVDAITNNPIFRGLGGGATRPGTFTIRQDATIADANIPSLAQFGAPIDGMVYRLQSNDLSIGISTASKVDNTRLTLSSNTGSTINPDLNLLSLDVFGSARLNGDIASMFNQTYNGPVTLGGDRHLSGMTLTFHDTLDGVGGGAQSLLIDGDATVFNGAVGALESLKSLEVNGTTAINGQAVTTAGSQLYNDAVTLGDNARLVSWDDGTIRFGGTLDGDHNLRVETSPGGLIVFGDNVGASQALRNMFLSTSFGVGVRSIPNRATIVGEKSISIDALNFEMGQHEKFTTLGSLDLRAVQRAILGDLTTVNDMRISAGIITLLRRFPDDLLVFNGSTTDDRGLDFVSGGIMQFSGNIVLGGAPGAPNPTFGNPFAGAVNSPGLNAFEISFSDVGRTTLDALMLNGVVLDQKTLTTTPPPPPPPPNFADDLAASRPQDPEFNDSVIPEVYDLELLNRLSISSRGPGGDEITEFLDSPNIFRGQPDSPQAFDQERTTPATRIPTDAVLALAAIYDGLFGEEPEAVRGAMSESFAGALDAFFEQSPGGDADPRELRAFIETDPAAAQALANTVELERMLQQLRGLGLPPAEYVQTRNRLIAAVTPTDRISADRLAMMIDGTTLSAGATPRAVSTKEPESPADGEKLSRRGIGGEAASL